MLWAMLPLLACGGSPAPLTSDAGAPPAGGQSGVQTTWSYLLPAQRPIDLLFVIDNSASMAAKQDILLQNLSEMMRSMEKLEGGLPDVHIGVISTDMGAGEGVTGGDCSARFGDQGLLWGNDPAPGALATVAGGPGNGCGLTSGVRWIEDRICPDGSKRYRNYEGELPDVLPCMGKALGNHGCGYSHALQSLRLALNPEVGINEANRGFLRRRAPLIIIIISDKDDCSADPSREDNDGMFSASNPGDSPTLRCAARGHVCDGREIPHYDPSTGYDGSHGPWTANFEACAAKQPDSHDDPHWLPLISVQEAIDSVRQIKDSRDGPIWVAGVMGWPKGTAADQAEYRIDKAAAEGPWELSSICGVSSVQGDGANVYPAYRLKQFIDAFPESDGGRGLTLSMCDNHWADVIKAVSYSNCCIDRWPPCLRYPLIDVDPDRAGIQPDCQVSLWSPGDDSGDCGGQPAHDELVPECLDPSTGLPVDPDNPRPQLDAIPESRRPCWYIVRDTNESNGCPRTSEHQKLDFLWKPGQLPPQDGMWTATCLTEPRP
jgi:hypothetical protein